MAAVPNTNDHWYTQWIMLMVYSVHTVHTPAALSTVNTYQYKTASIRTIDKVDNLKIQKNTIWDGLMVTNKHCQRAKERVPCGCWSGNLESIFTFCSLLSDSSCFSWLIASPTQLICITDKNMKYKAVAVQETQILGPVAVSADHIISKPGHVAVFGLSYRSAVFCFVCQNANSWNGKYFSSKMHTHSVCLI